MQNHTNKTILSLVRRFHPESNIMRYSYNLRCRHYVFDTEIENYFLYKWSSKKISWGRRGFSLGLAVFHCF